MSEDIVKKRAGVLGFSEQDQEDIALKFQKISDDRKGRTGLGFTNTNISPAACTTDPSSASPSSAVSKTKTQEDKVNNLKTSIHTIEKDTVASALHRREIIAQIQGSPPDRDSITHITPLSGQDIQHQAAIFSTQMPDMASSPLPTNPKVETKASFFNRKQATEPISTDAPLYKRLAVGDTVYAFFAEDGQFHKANIISVMHGGYHSAQYDVQYHGYPDKTTLSWTDLQPFSDLREEEHIGGMPSTASVQRETGSQVDAFGRSLSERDTQAVPTPRHTSTPLTAETVSHTVSGMTMTGEHISDRSNSIVTANMKASDDFLQGMLHTTLDTSNGDHRNHAEKRIVYEAPITAIKFSLDSIVDSAFFANRSKGEWRKIA